MTISRQTLLLFLAFLVTIFCGCQADTKVLGTVSISVFPGYGLRDETISLDNENQLVVKGQYSENYNIPQDRENILHAVVDYMGDKNGYHAKYSLKKEQNPILMVQHLSPSTLKTLAG